MSDFSAQQWQESAPNALHRFRGWLTRPRQGVAHLTYGAVAGLSLWPIVEAIAQTPASTSLPIPIFVALGSIAGGVGSNLLAEQLQRWADQSEPPTEEDVITWVSEQAVANAELRTAFDEIISKLEALPTIQTQLSIEQQTVFVTQLRQEMAELGNLDRFSVHLTVGSGAIAYGDQSTALGERSVNVKGDVGGSIVTGDRAKLTTVNNTYNLPPDVDETNWRESYLHRIFTTCRALSLAGIDPKVASEERDSRLNLGAVYTALLTQAVDSKRGQFDHGQFDRDGGMPMLDQRRIPALEQLNQHDHLVLLGDPGSGKSTFVNFVALCMAGAGLEHETLNLKLLTAPLPNDEGQTEDEPQKWDHGVLLPVIVTLRDFAARGLPAVGEEAKAKHLWRFITNELKDASLA